MFRGGLSWTWGYKGRNLVPWLVSEFVSSHPEGRSKNALRLQPLGADIRTVRWLFDSWVIVREVEKVSQDANLITAESAEFAESGAAGLNTITESILGAAMKVHTALGPGLLESAYEACLAFELVEMGFEVAQQQPMPVTYRGVRLACRYRTDLIVDGAVIVEVKAVSGIEPIHEAQVISYLKLSNRQVGL